MCSFFTYEKHVKVCVAACFSRQIDKKQAKKQYSLGLRMIDAYPSACFLSTCQL